jgi:hypothetical protein
MGVSSRRTGGLTNSIDAAMCAAIATTTSWNPGDSITTWSSSVCVTSSLATAAQDALTRAGFFA